MSVRVVDRRALRDEFARVSGLPTIRATADMLELSARVKSFSDVVDSEGASSAISRFGDPDQALAEALMRKYGGKGLGLIRSAALAQKVRERIRERYGEDIPVEVPKFELLGDSFFDEFERNNRDVLEKLAEMREDSTLSYDRRRDLMLAAASECTLSERNLREVREKYARLGGDVMVRSSATCEDASEKSYAGKFDSLSADKLPFVELNVLTILQRFLVERALDPGIGEGEKMTLVLQDRIKPDSSGIAFSTLPESIGQKIPLTHLEVVLGSPGPAVRGNSSTMLNVGFDDGEFKVYEVAYGFRDVPEQIDFKDELRPLKPDEYLEWKKRLWREKAKTVFEEASQSMKASPISQEDARRMTIVSRAYAELLGYTVDMEFGITDGAVQCLQTRPVTGVEKGVSVDVSDLEARERRGELTPVVKTPICISFGRCEAPLVYFDEQYARHNIKDLDNEAASLEAQGNHEEAGKLRQNALALRRNIQEVNSRFRNSGYILAIGEAARTVGPESDELFSNRLALVDPLYGSRTAHGAIQTREWCKGDPRRFYLACPGYLDELKKHMTEDQEIPGVWVSKRPFIAYSLGFEGDLIPT